MDFRFGEFDVKHLMNEFRVLVAIQSLFDFSLLNELKSISMDQVIELENKQLVIQLF